MAAISIRGLVKTIHKETILDIENLSFEKNTKYGIIGGNGAGKSMLLKAITGLICFNGEIEIMDSMTPRNYLPNTIGALIERPGFMSDFSGYKNLLYISDLTGEKNYQTISKLLRYFDLDQVSNKKYRKYSLGMKQKLGIIAALMDNAPIIILDEPFSNLDANAVSLLKEKLRSLSSTILITSHTFEDVEDVCDIIIEIENGKVKDTIETNHEQND